MSDELLNKIFDKLVSIGSEIKEIKDTVDRVEKKLDSTHEQVVFISESHTIIKQELNTHEHHFNVVDKQLTTLAIDVDKLKHK